MISKERFKCYLTGVEDIDSEHWAILTKFGELSNVLLNSTEDNIPEAIEFIEDLKSILQGHFKTEMKYMQSIGYTWTIPHDREHVRIINALTYAEKVLQKGGIVGNYKALELGELFINHIDAHDMQYVTPSY